MGSIPGPLIKFRFDQPSAKQAAQQITKTLQSQFQTAGKSASALFAQSLTNTVGRAGKATAEQFASAWQAAAAKLRASLSTEKLGLNAIGQAREKIIGLARQEISVLSKKDQLNKAELSHLKSATVEIEKQRNALAGRGAMTNPTRQIVQQMISGIGLRAGSYGGGLGSFAGLRVSEPLGKFAEEASGAKLALLGIGVAALAAGAALTKMAISGGKFAVEMQHMAEKSGISVNSLIQLRSVSKALDLDFDTVTRGFKKFDTEITYAMGASLPHASEEAVRAGAIFRDLGVNVKQAAADPMTAMEKLTQTLGQLPDGAVRTAVAVMLFGKAGQEMIPVLKHWQEAAEGTKKSSQDLAKALGTDVAHSADALQIQMVNFDNEAKALEVTLAQKVIPALVSAVSWFTRVADAIGHPGNTFEDVTGAVAQQLRAQKLQFNAKGTTDFQAFLRQYQAMNAPMGTLSKSQASAFISNPQSALNAFYAFLADQAHGAAISPSGEFSKFVSQGATGSSPKDISELQKHLARDVVMNTGGGGRKQDFSEPLYLKDITKEWKKLQEQIAKSNEALKKHTELMAKLSAATFAQNSFMTTMLGPIGIAADSPDKTGAGIQKFFDAINEANLKTAKKAQEEWKNQFDKLKESVGGLFDAMLQGSKSFGEALKRMIETALLAPIKEAFSTKIAQMIQALEKNVQAHAGKNAKGGGGILAKIMASIGLGGPTTTAQQNVAQSNVNTMTVGSLTILGNTLPGGAGAPNIPKPTGNPFLSMFGGGNASLTSLAGVGGFSMALAAAGGTAIAGSGGAAVAGGGGMAAVGGPGGVTGAASAAGAIMQKVSGNGALGTIGSMLPGLAMLGIGLGTRNGAAMALGIGAAGAGLLGSLGSRLGGKPSAMSQIIGGAKLSQLSRPQSAGDWLNAAGSIVSGAGMMFAGNQTGGLGGAAMGALGGLQAGAEIGTMIMPGIGTAIGAVVGTIGGALMGAFGKKNNQQAWNKAVTKAANNQRITQPLSENFAFAAMNTMASTFGTTFGQGPGGFSNSTLPANTPFWANAILGTPHGTSATIAWNQMMNGINPNSPFFGGTNTSPFNGGVLPNGLRLPGAPSGVYSRNAGYGVSGGGASNVQVHFTVPGYVDKAGLADIVNNAAPLIHQTVAQSVYKQSSGMRRATTRAVWLP